MSANGLVAGAEIIATFVVVGVCFGFGFSLGNTAWEGLFSKIRKIWRKIKCQIQEI